jgi:hypothetical protein
VSGESLHYFSYRYRLKGHAESAVGQGASGVIDYVLLHELSHLLHHKHSPSSTRRSIAYAELAEGKGAA